MEFYFVLLRSRFVRDAQYIDTSNLSDEELEEFDSTDYRYDELWRDLEPTVFVSVVVAQSEKEACKNAAEKYYYNARSLYAVKMIPNQD